MSRVFVTSDQHFGHTNVIKYCERPFDTIEQMDYEIIKRWNNTVGKLDKVFVLGDFSFHDEQKTKDILEKLHGTKSLIMGNHDRKRITSYYDMGFKEVSKYPIIYADFYILSHEPMFINGTMPYINIHGHTHQLNYMDGANRHHYNVCVEKTNYTPILFSKCGSIKFLNEYEKIGL